MTRLAVLAIACVMVGVASGPVGAAPAAARATAAPALADVTTLADFQTMFDKGRGQSRIVLLLSPT